MHIDAILPDDETQPGQAAAERERTGYRGVWVGETRHDPFLQVQEISLNTESVDVGTAVAIAFGRTPLTVATAGYDLARISEGRFVLGLGSQVKAHIERRFSMPWSQPASRMREFVLAMRAIWECWNGGAELNFRGEFYTHTLMPPLFAPPTHAYGPPQVLLAAVGPRMTEVAGEVADGLLFHPFNSPRHLQEVTLPALGRGRLRSGHVNLDGFEIAGSAIVCVGRDDQELERAVVGTRERIAFYGSTAAYRSVLELHGYGDLQPALSALAREGRWSEMGLLVDDDLLTTLAVVGSPSEVATLVDERWSGLADRVALYAPYNGAGPALDATLEEIAAAARA